MRRPSTPSPKTPPGRTVRHGRRVLDAARHDPYALAHGHGTTARCTECTAIYERGRWRWGEAPEDARAVRCPACRRIADRLPAGHLVIEGPSVSAVRAELLAGVRHVAEHERGEHPQNRIFAIEEGVERIDVYTTDIHLPQRIGEALKRAHDGALSVRYGRGDYSVRARWRG